MRFCSLFAVCLTLTLSSTGFSMDKNQVDELIAKIEKAADPQGTAKNIKTRISKAELIIPQQKIKMSITTYTKFPDKNKVVTEIPGIMKSVTVLNGEKAWESSPAMGTREITGTELASMKFDIDMRRPDTKMRDVFSKIELADKLEKVGEFMCYKMVCTPKKKYSSKPVTLYFDNKKFYLRKTVMTSITKMGPIKSETILKDFKIINGRPTAMTITVKQMNISVLLKTIKIENNVKIADSEFAKPETASKPLKQEPK